MSLYNDAKLILTPNAYKEGVLYTLKPTPATVGNFDVVRATSATRVNENGLIESVGNDIARLDYTNGEASVLVEPQRTNEVLYSEDYNDSYWTKVDTTITPNDVPSILKGELADRIVQNTGTIGRIERAIPVPDDSVTRCLSLFIKKEAVDKFSLILMRIQGGSTFRGTSIQINKKTGVYLSPVPGVGSGFTDAIDVGVVDYGDYLRVFISIDNNSTGNTNLRIFLFPNRGEALGDLTQNDGDAVFAGIQVEEGTAPASLIPTEASTVTRNADVNNVTPPIGTTEITEYFEDGTTNVITSIPATYTIPNGRISKIIMI